MEWTQDILTINVAFLSPELWPQEKQKTSDWRRRWPMAHRLPTCWLLTRMHESFTFDFDIFISGGMENISQTKRHRKEKLEERCLLRISNDRFNSLALVLVRVPACVCVCIWSSVCSILVKLNFKQTTSRWAHFHFHRFFVFFIYRLLHIVAVRCALLVKKMKRRSAFGARETHRFPDIHSPIWVSSLELSTCWPYTHYLSCDKLLKTNTAQNDERTEYAEWIYVNRVA